MHKNSLKNNAIPQNKKNEFFYGYASGHLRSLNHLEHFVLLTRTAMEKSPAFPSIGLSLCHEPTSSIDSLITSSWNPFTA